MKHFFLILAFLLLPFSIPNNSITPPIFAQPTNQEEEKTGWEKFWDSVGALINSLSFNIGSWFTKEHPISVENNQENFTDYDNKNKDVNTRALAEKNQSFHKGTYLKKIIDGTYEDKVIAYICDNKCTNTETNDCSDIKFSTLVFHFYQKNQKILYDSDNPQSPIDYDSEKMDSYNYTLPQGLDQCFQNLYNNMSSIPQGLFQGKDNSAAASSKELNNSSRNFIPNSSQEQAPSSDMDDPDNVEALTKDNDLQQRTVFSNFIPNKSHDPSTSEVSTDTNNLKNTFTDYMHPDSWQQE